MTQLEVMTHRVMKQEVIMQDRKCVIWIYLTLNMKKVTPVIFYAEIKISLNFKAMKLFFITFKRLHIK